MNLILFIPDCLTLSLALKKSLYPVKSSTVPLLFSQTPRANFLARLFIKQVSIGQGWRRRVIKVISDYLFFPRVFEVFNFSKNKSKKTETL